jgi:hypothetical protein
MADQPEAIRRLRHDLANPLAALLAETQLLLLNESTLDPDTVRGLRDIEAIARHMKGLLEASRQAPAGPEEEIA